MSKVLQHYLNITLTFENNSRGKGTKIRYQAHSKLQNWSSMDLLFLLGTWYKAKTKSEAWCLKPRAKMWVFGNKVFVQWCSTS